MPRWTESDLRAYEQRTHRPVAGLQDPQRQPNQRRQGQDRQLDKSTEGVAIRVSIISIRKRRCDEHDNLKTGAKPLVDAITYSLGFQSDDDRRLQWDYHQVIGKPEGTIVVISTNQ